MAVILRLTRMGKKKNPFYRIVAADSRVRRDGKYIEKVGHYNPLNNPAEIEIDEEKTFYWLKNGAIPTETVKNLFSQKGIMLKWHLKKQGCDDTKIEEEYKKWEVLQLEKQRRQEALAEQAKREPAQQEAKEESAPETAEVETSILEEVVPTMEQPSEPEKKEQEVES